MKLYLLKYNMLYYVCDCPKDLIIPTNDFEAYKTYKMYEHLYNKKWIAKSQNIECGSGKTFPKKYPVIVRPQINLHGMGKGTHYVYSQNKLQSISNNDFWTEIINGNHISIDVFINKYGILGTIAFLGIPDTLFTFKYWEYLPDFELPLSIKKWIESHLTKFIGVFNIEIINNKIIECHLRMGDLNYFQNEELIRSVILCHAGKSIVVHKLNKMYLIRVFVKKGNYKKLKKEEIFSVVRKYDISVVLNYFIDPNPINASNVSNPLGGDRVCNFTVTSLDVGLKIKKHILENFFAKNA